MSSEEKPQDAPPVPPAPPAPKPQRPPPPALRPPRNLAVKVDPVAPAPPLTPAEADRKFRHGSPR